MEGMTAGANQGMGLGQQPAQLQGLGLYLYGGSVRADGEGRGWWVDSERWCVELRECTGLLRLL